MTTWVELQQCFFPLVRQIQDSGLLPIWNADPSIPRTIATAPAIESAADDNGNYGQPISPGGLTTGFLTVSLTESHEEEQHCLAKFLSSGDKNDLDLKDSNIHFYLQFAAVLHHTTLEKLCEDYLQNNQNKPWESGTCFCEQTNNRIDKKNENNNTNVNATVNDLNFPKFQILFLKQLHSEDHINVLVIDVRKLNDDQTISYVKKVSRFEEGFACCTAYYKQCPYIIFSGRNSKKENALIKYDVVGHKWFHCPDMRHARAKHAMAFVNNGVYIIGGKKCSVIEKYDVVENNCSDVGTLPVAVYSAAHAVYRNKIYVFGGKNIRGKVSAVQCIDTNTNIVSRLQDLPFQCCGGQAIVVKDTIFFATDQGHLIKFNPVLGQSELCAQQPYRRKHFVMFEKESNLHLFGGVRTDGRTEHESTMYTYNQVADTWQQSLSFGVPLPVQASCTVTYPKECPVKPFTKLFGYC